MFRRIISLFVKKTFLRKRLTLIQLKKKRYSDTLSHEEIYQYQIEKFNRVWGHCIANIPFYTKWRQDHNLPDRINSIEDLKLFPVLTKQHVHQNQEFILQGLDNYYLTSTGGTSGITTHFPTSKKNADEAYANAYLGRSWWGINPLDDILMFWGHSHLFGKGIKRFFSQFKRWASDFVINTKRVSCYDLDASSVHSFYGTIESMNPKAIISYSSNIFKVCQYMKSNSLHYEGPRLNGVILTSETVTKADTQLIEGYLNTNVINEYGMAETGAIAYSFRKTDNIRVFWDSFIVTSNKQKDLMLTTIGDSIFPLINYSSEDLAEVKSEYKASILSLRKVLGKARDVLNVCMLDGSKKEISTIFFDHVLKFYPDIYSIHYQQDRSDVVIFLTSDKRLNLRDVKSYLYKEISKEFHNIDYSHLSVVQVDDVKKTIAGKNKTFLSL